MKLRTVQVREFKSVWDSNPFEVDRVACLVGKNEAGKTAILQALYRLNPIVDGDGHFDATDDYPRSEVENYQQDIEAARRTHAVVVEATFELDAEELDAIRKEYGEGALASQMVTVSKGYAKDERGKCAHFVSVPVVEATLARNLAESFALPEPLKGQAAQKTTIAQLSTFLADVGQHQDQRFAAAQAAAAQIQDEVEKAAALERSTSLAESEQAKALRGRLAEMLKQENIGIHIWQRRVSDHLCNLTGREQGRFG